MQFSSRIEGTQASLDDLLASKAHAAVDSAPDHVGMFLPERITDHLRGDWSCG